MGIGRFKAADLPKSDYQRNHDAFASYWTQRWRRTNTYSSQTKVKRFRKLLSRHGLLSGRGLRVFDQGFGLGLMLFCFDRSCALAGLELSSSAVEAAARAARDRGHTQVDLRVFDPNSPYPPEWQGEFDIVISSHVLEHIENPAPALASLLALLRPGAYACIIVPINEKDGEDPNHFHQFTSQSLIELLRVHGMEIVALQEADRLWRFMTPVAYRLAQKRTIPLTIASFALNLCGFMPEKMMSMVDMLLRRFGVPNRQCLVLARTPTQRLPA